MEEFIFHQGLVPIGYSYSFAESLFNQEEHRQLQSKSNWHSFYILNQYDKTIRGSIHFHLQDGIAHSPFKATHGGFDFDEGIQNKIILNFIVFIEQQLQELGIIKIFVRLPLRATNENEFTLLENALLKSGFQISKKEEGCILKVTESFDERIHYSKKKSLKKTVRNSFQFNRVDISEIEDIYSFLLRCRKEKDYELSMSWKEMKNLVFALPDKIVLFNVKDGDQLVAASICIRVSNIVLYDFYHDHDVRYDEFSPIVFLVKGIHDYGYQNQIPLIDLGTAMIGDKVNTGLMEFKLKLGADRAIKYSFEKKLI